MYTLYMSGLKWKLCYKKSRVLASARMPPLIRIQKYIKSSCDSTVVAASCMHISSWSHLFNSIELNVFCFHQCIRASSLFPCFDCTLYTSLVFNGGVRHWESSPLMMKLRYLRQTRISSPSLFSLGKIQNLKHTRLIFRNQWWTLFLFSKSFSKETHFLK